MFVFPYTSINFAAIAVSREDNFEASLYPIVLFNAFNSLKDTLLFLSKS